MVKEPGGECEGDIGKVKVTNMIILYGFRLMDKFLYWRGERYECKNSSNMFK